MHSTGGYFVTAAGGLFFLYFANVVTGSMGSQVFLSDVGEMLTLFGACIIFVIGILFLEKQAKTSSSTSPNA